MDSTVDLSFRYVEADYVRAMRAHYASRLRLRIDAVVIAVLAAAGVYLLQSPDLRWYGLAALAVDVFFALMLISAFTVIPRLAFRREPKFRDDYSLTFSPEGIHFQTADIDSQLQWGMYSKALIDSHSYVLYYGSHQFTVVPKRVFVTADQREAFEQLLKQKINNIVRRGD